MGKNKWLRTLGWCVAASALLSPTASGQPKRLKSECGHVELPAQLPDSGIICVGVCGEADSRQSCVYPGAPKPTGWNEPLSNVTSISLVVAGNALSVAELATQLQRMTGWTVGVHPGLKARGLRSQAWRGSWKRFNGARLKAADGSRIQVIVDDAGRSVVLAPVQ